MKKFYSRVHAATENGSDGYHIFLDGKAVKTPAKAALTLPSAALAEAVASEWRAQDDVIDPSTMPLTQLSSTAIDLVTTKYSDVIDQVAAYAATDLVCYPAHDPEDLAAKHEKHWAPLRDYAQQRYDITFVLSGGLLPVEQDKKTLDALRAAVEAYDIWPMTALQALTAATGSLIIALAVVEDHVDADAAYQAAFVDDLYQMELWGHDSETADRLERLQRDIAAATRFLQLVKTHKNSEILQNAG